MNRYAYPVSLVSLSYCALSLFIGGVFFYYQCIARDEVIVKPVYVNNISGIPVIEYNPRIGMVTKKMASGDIFDRNGVLIATSDREMLDSLIADSVYRNLGIDVDIPKIQRRYYPFGEHLFFMLGDLNTGDLMSSRGFMAEDRYMSRLRGYDNAMYERDSEGNVKLDENGDSICDWCGATLYIPGDVDGDGGVDSDDAIYLLYYTFNAENYPLNQDGDFDGDGNVDSDDAIYLLYYTFNPTDYPLH